MLGLTEMQHLPALVHASPGELRRETCLADLAVLRFTALSLGCLPLNITSSSLRACVRHICFSKYGQHRCNANGLARLLVQA